MSKVILIGAGGVGTVVAHKMAQNAEVFTDILIASRTKAKCDALAEAIGADPATFAKTMEDWNAAVAAQNDAATSRKSWSTWPFPIKT